MRYISMFSVIVSTSAHFNQQLLLTRLTELDNEVFNYLNLGHPSQNDVCGWSRLESDSITVELCSTYSGDSSNCIVLPKKWNEQEPCGQQCANWRMMDQDKHHQCIISLGFFQGISMLLYSSIWKWERVTVLFRSLLSSMIWSGHTYANIYEYGHTYVKLLWMTKGEDLSCAIPWHNANCKRNIKKN